jgi:hypothetical protein
VVDVLLGEIRAGVALALIDGGTVIWWANLAWAAALLAAAGHIAAPHLKRLAELANPHDP